mmetsp:Transcript_106623/g.318701  ORF Transcript_106623/g.318701 Transcript_106623/m.318701 type:complete len:91 (+) Transcript_106623:567-839(+)
MATPREQFLDREERAPRTARLAMRVKSQISQQVMLRKAVRWRTAPSQEETELEARQAHRMDVTIFAPEAPHRVPGLPVTEAEARACFRMD